MPSLAAIAPCRHAVTWLGQHGASRVRAAWMDGHAWRIAGDTVGSAGHCLGPKEFVRCEIGAPLAAGKPRVKGSKASTFGGDYNVVENPDIGLLQLAGGVDLPHYAELTNVVAEVEAGA